MTRRLRALNQIKSCCHEQSKALTNFQMAVSIHGLNRLPIEGSYNGEWRAGNFHGQGEFHSSHGVVCNGYWDANLGAGYGTWYESPQNSESSRNKESNIFE